MDVMSTGIPWLDSLFEGGVAKGSVALIVGPVGTLKFHMGRQLICAGLKAGEKCLYISTLDTQKDFEDQMKCDFDLNVKPLFEKGLLNIVDLNRLFVYEPSELVKPLDLAFVAETVFTAVKKVGMGRIVFSNVAHLFTFLEDAKAVFKLILGVRFYVKKAGSTLYLIMDEGCVEKIFEENIKTMCDYIIVTGISGGSRKLRVLRAPSRHDLGWHLLTIREKGVEVDVSQ